MPPLASSRFDGVNGFPGVTDLEDNEEAVESSSSSVSANSSASESASVSAPFIRQCVCKGRKGSPESSIDWRDKKKVCVCVCGSVETKLSIARDGAVGKTIHEKKH